MAAGSMGAFGIYKIAYSRHRAELEKMEGTGGEDPVTKDTVWVVKRYVPTDLRTTAPVPRHKLMPVSGRQLPTPEEYWIPPGDPNPRFYSRMHEESDLYASAPSTRCEEWSTLRQICPSRGIANRVIPPNWGTGFAKPPITSTGIQRKFPHINSQMTRYMDDMHTTDKLFKLY